MFSLRLTKSSSQLDRLNTDQPLRTRDIVALLKRRGRLTSSDGKHANHDAKRQQCFKGHRHA